MEQIITRFPPSPTGYLHVGGARTALFNWLYARNKKGNFILRIEDTDTERSTKVSVDAILESLEWLGIDWDDGPYFQSERFDLYKIYIQKLLDNEKAYYCTCSPEKLDQMRKEAMAAGRKPKYDGSCREKNLPKSDNSVIRFKAPETGTTIIDDIIKKNIIFQNTELDDFIIERSDGTPTYNLAVVVDDITMNINTIIRGDDHVNNTPKQIMLYKALGATLPKFGHVPMVLGKDKTRLSKRHGAMSVFEYKNMGFLPDAMINYLVRLGWSYGGQEFFTIEELIEKFTLNNIGRSPGVFDTDKLHALNGDHINASDPSKLVQTVKPFFEEKGYDTRDEKYIETIIKSLNTRSKTFKDMADQADFYYLGDNIIYEEKAANKFMKQEALEPLNELISKFEALEIYNEENVEKIFTSVLGKTNLKFGKVGPPVRVALTGRSNSPAIYEVVVALGKKITVARLKKAVDIISEKPENNT